MGTFLDFFFSVFPFFRLFNIRIYYFYYWFDFLSYSDYHIDDMFLSLFDNVLTHMYVEV